jgi:hypothetical protein
MIVLLASDRSVRSDGGLMVQKYHSPGPPQAPGPPQGRQYPARRQRHWFAQDLSFGLDHCEKTVPVVATGLLIHRTLQVRVAVRNAIDAGQGAAGLNEGIFFRRAGTCSAPESGCGVASMLDG